MMKRVSSRGRVHRVILIPEVTNKSEDKQKCL